MKLDPNPAEALFGGPSETKELQRSLDWSTTRLGPISEWPDELRAAIRTLLSSSRPLLLWWGPDLAQLYNDAVLPLLGDKHPRAMGQRAAECFSEVWGTMGPMVEGVLAGGAAVDSENLLLRLNRHGYLEETYWTFSYSPIHDQFGSVVGIFNPTTDTTQAVLRERRLQTLYELGRVSPPEALTTAASCVRAMEVLAGNRADIPFAAINLLDGSGTTLNLAAHFGGARDDVQTNIVPGPDDALPVWQVVTRGRPVLVQEMAAEFGSELQPSVLGDVVPDSCLVLPITEGGPGNPVGALVLGISPYRALDAEYRLFLESVGRQLSVAVSNARAHEAERRRAEALAEVNAAKTQFFENVSHEFRTPLTLMLGPVQAVLAETGSTMSAGNRAALEEAVRGARRLRRLVDSLLDFARSDANQLSTKLVPTNLAALTADCASMFRSAIERGAIEFVVDTRPLSTLVDVDQEMWVKMVSNLLSNAVKFTQSGRITVGLWEAADEVVLVVRDTGVGIAADEVPRIFGRFHRVSDAVAPTPDGAGIGLSLVADLAAAHGGRVSVDSTVGVGSTFRVVVPMRRSDQIIGPEQPAVMRAIVSAFTAESDGWRDAGAADQPAVTGSLPGAGRILLVEDNADLRAYLSRLLREDGWEVVAVGDVPTALRRLEPRPDLVLSDVMLPGVDGLSFVRTLRSTADVARIPVILLTARAGSDSAAEGLAAGADDYVVKPFDAIELLARVRVHFELSRLRDFALDQAERRSSNLETALASNRQIGAAIGILMHRFKVTEDEGFGLLRRTSQEQHRKLRDVADEVVHTGTLPAPKG